jgi:Flp pilus assembly protein TadG
MVGEHGIAGAALIEFTIFAPLLVIMSIYTMDFGLLFFKKMDVQNAAQAGVDWAVANRGIYDPSAISSAVTHATNYSAIVLDPNYKACPATPGICEQCGCPSSTGVTFTTYSGATCPKCGTSAGGLYVTVKAQATYSSFIPYGLISSTNTLKATSTARIQ